MAINGVVVDLKIRPDVHCAVWDAFEVRGTEQRIVMEVARWEGENLVRCIAMEDTFELFPGMELTWLKGAIHVPVGETVPGRVMTCWATPMTSAARSSPPCEASTSRARPRGHAPLPSAYYRRHYLLRPPRHLSPV